MKTILKAMMLSIFTGLLFLLDVSVSPVFPLQVGVGLVPEAEAILGVRRRAFRRGVVIGESAAATSAAAATSTAVVQSQPATSTAPAATVPAEAPPPVPAASDKALPLGTVVSSLPENCKSEAKSGVNYYHCGSNFYRAVFQGNQLVYVTAKP